MSLGITAMSSNNTTTVTMTNTDTTDFDYESMFVEQIKQQNHVNKIRMIYIGGYFIICTLGVVLNPVAIIAGIWSGGKTTTAKCVLALAVTHFICSAFLPWQILYSWYHFNWHYGAALCKLSSYVLYGSMFSTAGIMTVWSIHCKECRRFPFQNTSGVTVMILCAWIFAAILSISSLFSRELRNTELGKQCVDDFDLDDAKTTSRGRMIQTVVVWYRFLIGIVIPAFLIGVCCCCQRSSKDKNLMKIKALIITAYFVFWTPLLFIGLLQDNLIKHDYSDALPVATVLATAHCCINPLIYLVVSPTNPVKWMKEAKTHQSSNSLI